VTIPHPGELAALATACCWATSALAFEAAGKRIGSLAVNFIRLIVALAALTAFEAIIRGHALPTDASMHAWVWLAISGLVGFAFGDLCLFRAFVVLGPRLSTLMMSLAPPLTAIMAWLFLDERVSGTKLLGMALTVGGIVWAILARAPDDKTKVRSLVGILLGLGGAVGQAGGLVLSKYGMGDYDAFAATQIRIIAGIVGFALMFSLFRRWPYVRAAARNQAALGFTSIGAVFGPFLGVSLSLVAVKHTHAGVAASIMATTPIVIIPAVILLRKERVGLGGLLGAAIAVAGVAVLFL
jgi:drug/metabolite transporter (DMT)-like permease